MAKYLSTTALVLALSTGSAFADGHAISWTGYHIGLNAGYVGTKVKINEYFSPGGGGIAAFSTSDRSSGAIGGIQAGYNWQTSAFVIGLEADIQASNTGDTKVIAPVLGFGGIPIVGSSRTISSDLKAFGTARARVGVSVQKALIYVTGGLAFGRIKDSAVVTFPMLSYTATSSIWKAGWTAGAGVEYAINDSWSFKGEYLYFDLMNHTTAGPPSVPAIMFNTVNEWRNNGHIVRAGFNYRFGG